MEPRKVGCLQTIDSLNFPLHFVSDWVNSSCESGRLVWQCILQLHIPDVIERMDQSNVLFISDLVNSDYTATEYLLSEASCGSGSLVWPPTLCNG